MGIDVSEEHFYTSALATAEFIRSQNPKASAYVLGEAGLLNALYDAGIAIDDVNPDYVIVDESASYSLNTLTRATNLVLAGAKLIGANSDVSGPIENGIAPACRALMSPIEMATGKQAYFCGKPNPLMMRTGLNLLNCHILAFQQQDRVRKLIICHRVQQSLSVCLTKIFLYCFHRISISLLIALPVCCSSSGVYQSSFFSRYLLLTTFMDRLALISEQNIGSVGRITIPSFLPPFGYSPSARASKASTVG